MMQRLEEKDRRQREALLRSAKASAKSSWKTEPGPEQLEWLEELFNHGELEEDEHFVFSV